MQKQINYPSELTVYMGYRDGETVFLSGSAIYTRADYDPDTDTISNIRTTHPEELSLETIIDLMAKDHLLALQNELDQSRLDYNRLSTEYSTLQGQMTQAVRDIEGLSGELSLSNTLLEKTKGEKARAVASLNAALAHVDQVEADIEAAREELAISNAATVQAKADLARLAETSDTTIRKLTADLKVRTAALDAATVKVNDTQIALSRANAEVKRLNISHEQAIEDLDNARERLKNTEGDLTEAKTHLDTARANLTRTKHDLETAHTEAQNLSHSLNVARSDLDKEHNLLVASHEKVVTQAATIIDDKKEIKTITLNWGKTKKKYEDHMKTHVGETDGKKGFKFDAKKVIPFAAAGLVLAILVSQMGGFSGIMKHVPFVNTNGLARPEHNLDFLKDFK